MATIETIIKTTGYILLKTTGTIIKASVALGYGPIEGIRNLILGNREKSELQKKYDEQIIVDFYNKGFNNKMLGIGKIIISPIVAIKNSFRDLLEDLSEVIETHKNHRYGLNLLGKSLFTLLTCIKLSIIIIVDLARIPFKMVRTIGNMFTAPFLMPSYNGYRSMTENIYDQGKIVGWGSYNDTMIGYYSNKEYLPEFFSIKPNFEYIGGLTSLIIPPVAGVVQLGNDLISCKRSIEKFYSDRKYDNYWGSSK